MHQAPALTLTLQPDPVWRNTLQIGGGIGLLVSLGWLGWHGVHTGALNAMGLACAVLSAIPGIVLFWQATTTRTTPGGTLSWQPACGLWQLQPAAVDVSCSPPPPHRGRIVCMVAGQDWMLLRHTGSGSGRASTWLPLSRRAHAAQWHALRCAVFSPGAASASAPGPTHPDE